MSNSPHILGPRYQVKERIGRGGMAEVYAGYDPIYDRPVAIKFPLEDLLSAPKFSARFRSEADNAAKLSHPAIVTVYDAGEGVLRSNDGERNQPYIVMELVKGRSLSQVLADGHALLIEEAIEITLAILSALEHSHSKGIIHRDIKPGNIMVTDDHKVKVVDFGISKEIDDAATVTVSRRGTYHYASPEQMRGAPPAPSMDIYSTGCLLYQILTGFPPFYGLSDYDLILKETPPKPALELAPDIPKGLNTVVMKALERDPQKRYQSAAEMRTALAHVVHNLPYLLRANRAAADFIKTRALRTTELGLTLEYTKKLDKLPDHITASTEPTQKFFLDDTLVATSPPTAVQNAIAEAESAEAEVQKSARLMDEKLVQARSERRMKQRDKARAKRQLEKQNSSSTSREKSDTDSGRGRKYRRRTRALFAAIGAIHLAPVLYFAEHFEQLFTLRFALVVLLAAALMAYTNVLNDWPVPEHVKDKAGYSRRKREISLSNSWGLKGAYGGFLDSLDSARMVWSVWVSTVLILAWIFGLVDIHFLDSRFTGSNYSLGDFSLVMLLVLVAYIFVMSFPPFLSRLIYKIRSSPQSTTKKISIAVLIGLFVAAAIYASAWLYLFFVHSKVGVSEGQCLKFYGQKGVSQDKVRELVVDCDATNAFFVLLKCHETTSRVT
ncbi:MAG: protein kinase [Actinomycetaceae bacterium]|nr:protein kinase [Actinomycetaceae bacterium]